jgi:hypothetical protein
MSRPVYTAFYIFSQISPWPFILQSLSPVGAYGSRADYSYIYNIEQLDHTIHAHTPHLDMTLVVRNIRSLAKYKHHQDWGPWVNSQHPPGKRRIAIPAGKRNSHQGWSSTTSTIQGQNSTPSIFLIKSRVVDIILHISKRKFRLGGLAGSEWTRSVWAGRDTTLADCSAPSVTTRHQVARCPSIAVSPFLLALSVSYFKQTLWRGGQLWP